MHINPNFIMHIILTIKISMQVDKNQSKQLQLPFPSKKEYIS